MPVVGRNVREKIEADREFEIARIEVAEMVGTPRWNVVQQVFRKIAVRID